jgi:hypothetical protein
MLRRGFLAGVGTAASATLAGCGTDDPEFESGNGGGGDDSSTSEPDNDIEILEHQLLRENEGTNSERVSVEGSAENTSGEQLSYAEVRARFLDEDGALLESSLDNVNDLGSEMKWQFEISFPGFGEDAAAVSEYEIAVGNTY